MLEDVRKESVITDLYKEAYSMAEMIVPKSEEYMAASKEAQKKEAKLRTTLSPEQWNVFNQYMEAYHYANTFIFEETYKQGVVFGAKFMLEVLKE